MRIGDVSYRNFFPKGSSWFKDSKNKQSNSVENFITRNEETADTFIKNNSAVSFGYKFRLKTLWLKGKLPWLQYGFYGDKLTKQNISIEHLEPVSAFKQRMSEKAAKKVSTVWENVVLASVSKNQERSNFPLGDFINEEAKNRYLDQFRGKTIPGYGKGEKYIEAINKTIERLLNAGK